MRRREFIAILGGTAIAWPRAVNAQLSGQMRRIGVLMPITRDPVGQSYIAGFRQQLEALGWADGYTAQIQDCWSEADINHIRAQAAELVSLNPDVILVYAVRALAALKQATSTIPIVFIATSDPVGQGFVESLAKPGGNMTGFTLFVFSLIGKMLEVLKETAPQVTRVAVMFSPENISSSNYWRAFETVAPSFGVTPSSIPVRNVAEIEAGMAALAREPNGGLLLPTDVTVRVHSELIIALAARHRLPAVYSDLSFVRSGGLMSYGTDTVDLFRRAATYVDRILRGEKPADLPIQVPAKFELGVNLRTAEALGLIVPPSLLARANEAIE